MLKIESDNEKEIRLELKKIQLLELQIDELFEKKKFSEVEKLSVKLSYFEKINKNLI